MNSNLNIVATFAQDAGQFAFQASISQKNSIDIYPLDSSNNYEINSSLVNHLDYESHDLKASDILFVGWCSDEGNSHASTKTKRKLDENDEDSETKISKSENFFINAFEDGQVVTFSSTGKDIINIIRNKDKIKAADTIGSYIWILDNDDCVKKLEYNKTKPIKTFHLIDGKDEEITHFQVLSYNGNDTNEDGTYLALVTEQKVYIIDPSKRRPATVATFEIFGALSCIFSEDGKYFIISTIDKVSVYEYETKELIQSWDTQAEKIKTIKNLIFSLNIDGKLSVFRIGENELINSIRVANSEVIDFKQAQNDVMIAWLNVNEPNFKLLSVDNITGNKEIIINESTEETVSTKDSEKQVDETEAEPEVESSKQKNKKISKSEQTELNVKLIKALSKENEKQDNKHVVELLTSDSWNEQRIINFINNQLNAESLTASLLNKVIKELQDNVWTKNDQLHIWIKWIITLKNVPYSTIYDKKPKKNMKHLKINLKESSETLSKLLGMQGRLEMLNRQAKLREELSKLTVADGSDNLTIEEDEDTDHILNGEAVSNEDDEAITYVNGESDVFVDASEYINEAQLTE